MNVAGIQLQGPPSKEERKAGGIHYTPPALAQFLAAELATKYLGQHPNPVSLRILDPACGDGELLLALALALPPKVRARTNIIGYDTSALAVAESRHRLDGLGFLSMDVRCRDFLSAVSESHDDRQLGFALSDRPEFLPEVQGIDLVISNPPYVRTQVLGSEQAKDLARRFNLSGRVDLYHAFVVAMTRALRAGGFMGLLTSNRFLSTQAGASLREWLAQEFRLARLIDLGDTKLFDAAVLPAIVIAEKTRHDHEPSDCPFTRIYELQGADTATRTFESILDTLSQKNTSAVAVKNRRFRVEVGTLRTGEDRSVPWILTSDATDKWIESVSQRQAGVFADFGKVCVGIKTTADKVFIRDDWASLPQDQSPEDELLHNLITHHFAERWEINAQHVPTRKVLYPYVEVKGRRQPIALHDFPRAARYLKAHRERLERRQYLLDSGREWYEIWVPHSPADWQEPKIAFPDISSENTFFLAKPTWIVNGDCYWITLKRAIPKHYFLTLLAVANSSFIVRFYDVMFHNKLYAGRRRFMSQYVAKFPVPKERFARAISDVANRLLESKSSGNQVRTLALEEEADALVWESFDLRKEVCR